MEWLRETPPNELLWISIAASLIALWFAVPTILQMLYGRPKLELTWERETLGNRTMLTCWIHNRPVAQPVLRACGVRREAALGVWVNATIRQLPGQVPIATRRLMIHDTDGDERKAATIIASGMPAMAGVALFDEKDGSAEFAPMSGKEPVFLTPGTYEILLWVNAEQSLPTVVKNLHVGTHAPEFSLTSP